MKKPFVLALLYCLMAPLIHASEPDTIIVQTFSFSDPSPEGWGAPYTGTFQFPDADNSWEKILMVRHLKCDSATKGDKYPCGEWDYITQTYVKVPDGDTSEHFQLGSFVTPYGKRLKMGGEKGWKWFYDVTEYAPLLSGEVDLVSGNNQELLDMQFIFIKGTPVREVMQIENLYPTGLYKYGQLATDSVLPPKKVLLNENASGFKLRARISGHGHNGPRNCCEWDPKTHMYFVNEWELYRWQVWTDCGFNPIYPQGGTWPFDRAGWCPGTKVDEYDFEITDKVKPGDSVLIDYAIEMYKDNGERNGEYRMSHQLFSFGPPSFDTDARIVDIISPSKKDSYSRINPICGSPRIIIQNTGRHSLQSLDISYGLENGEKSTYHWTGELDFLEQTEVWLPAPSWKGLNKYSKFVVVLDKANGVTDDYQANNLAMSGIQIPPELPESFVIHIEANNKGRAVENAYTITNENGGILYERMTLADSTTYNDTIKLSTGCYSFILTDKMEDGMNRHWWYYRSEPEKMGINGKIAIHTLDGELIHLFPYDFGEALRYTFRVGNLP